MSSGGQHRIDDPPKFDTNLSPEHVQNQRVANAHGLTWSSQEGGFQNENGVVVFGFPKLPKPNLK